MHIFITGTYTGQILPTIQYLWLEVMVAMPKF